MCVRFPISMQPVQRSRQKLGGSHLLSHAPARTTLHSSASANAQKLGDVGAAVAGGSSTAAASASST